VTPKQSAPELLSEFIESNRGDYTSFGVYMVPEADLTPEIVGRDAGSWLHELGLEFGRTCDAIVIGLGDHLLVIKDRYRDTPYRIFGENLHADA